MSCITLFTSWRAGARVAAAHRCKTVNTDGICIAVAQKNRLAMNWHVVTDEKGHRHLEMRWKTQSTSVKSALKQL
jgi:hypothetical protein